MLVMVMFVFVFIVVVLVVMTVFIVFVFVVVIIVIVFISAFKMTYPGGTFKNSFKIKTLCVQNILNCNITVTCLNHLYVRLKRLHHRVNFFHFVRRYKVFLVDNQRRAEFNLLDKQGLNILLIHIFFKKRITAGKFVHQTLCVNNAYNVVKPSVTNLLNRLCNRHRFANSACFNQNVVKAFLCNKIFNLLDKIRLERTADTAVLKSDDAACVGDVCAFCNQAFINVYFADVIYDNGNFVSFLVGKDFVHQSRFAGTKIAAQKGNWS